jgi:hypothetical protein
VSALWALLTGGGELWPWLIGLATAFFGAIGLYFKGRSDAKSKARAKQAEADQAAHERMNDADTGENLTDAERRERLRGIARNLRD